MILSVWTQKRVNSYNLSFFLKEGENIFTIGSRSRTERVRPGHAPLILIRLLSSNVVVGMMGVDLTKGMRVAGVDDGRGHQTRFLVLGFGSWKKKNEEKNINKL